MTDYNDGNWHAWNGGDCPVHPKSEIEAVYLMNEDADSHAVFHNTAGGKAWGGTFLFRVTKAYREPRECWSYGAHIRNTEAEALAFRKAVAEDHPGKGYENHPITHWREMIE